MAVITDSTTDVPRSVEAPAPSGAAVRWRHLQENPASAVRWDWYALLRLIQAATPQHPNIGCSVQLGGDSVRLGQPPFFHPPASTVAELIAPGPARPGPADTGRLAVPRLQSYHFGLFGPNGPLPIHLTEIAYRQGRQKVPALAAFCDVLHHRFQSFFFRAWAQARKEVDFDRGSNPELERSELVGSPELEAAKVSSPPHHPWELYVGSLIGFGSPALHHRDRVPDHAKLFHAGRLARPTRNAEGLQAILGDYFCLPVRIVRFFARTVRLPAEVRCRLGGGSDAGGNGRLGLSAFAGESYIDHQIGFRIRIGPLRLNQLEAFLPGHPAMEELHDWIRFYMGRDTDPNPAANLEAVWDLQLVLSGPEAPPIRLGGGVRLGWTAWLHSAPCSKELDNLVLLPSARGPISAASRRKMHALAESKEAA